MKQYFQSLCHSSRHVKNISTRRNHVHTLLFLHVCEVFKCQRPHWWSPKSIRLHYCLQPSPAWGIVTEKPEEETWDGRENRYDYVHERGSLRKIEQDFNVHINLGDVSSVLCTWLPFLFDLFLFAALHRSSPCCLSCYSPLLSAC